MHLAALYFHGASPRQPCWCEFTAGSTAFSLAASWLTAPLENRTVGVNIDLFDASNNLLASDVFQGLNGSLATSQLIATNLIAGAHYALVFSGSAEQYGRYALALTASGSTPVIDEPSVAVPAVNRIFFDSHVGAKTFGSRVETGSELLIDGRMGDDQLSGIVNEFKFVSTATAFSAGIEWIVGAVDDPQRTVGVNVDIFDSNDVLVASDVLQGLFAGQAFSQLVAAGVAPGEYTIRLTATAALGGRYRIHLTTDGVPPGYEPITDAPPVTQVPEPTTWALLGLGLAALFGRRLSRCRTANPVAQFSPFSRPPT